MLWWMAGEFDRIGRAATEAIGARGSRVVVSAVVVWEVAIKRRLGKLEAPPDMLARLEAARVELFPITARHADRVGELPLHHQDPFDRLLIAQAQIEGFSFVSADEQLFDYELDLIW